MSSNLSGETLKHITSKTIRHYDECAEEFWHGTRDHDVSQNYHAFLSALPKDEKLRILDLGCGPGRDVLYFREEGHEVHGLDGSIEFCKMVQQLTDCKTLKQDFLDLHLENDFYDGIFANASLFHVPSQEFSRVLKDLWLALKPSGVLFSSNPRGNTEGWLGHRYGYYMEFQDYKTYLEKAGFQVLDHYYRPKNQRPEKQPWLAVVSQKRMQEVHGKEK